MARDPGSTWAPIPEAWDGAHVKSQFIAHSTGTTASAAANRRYFARGEVAVESTFIVGYSEQDPTLQVMDSAAKADANTTASRRAISVEVVGTAAQPFTDWQISELVRLGRWALTAHPDIKPQVCTKHDEPGFGWHVQFGAPGPWTTVRGKECPGPTRIRQYRDVVLPRIFTPTPQEDDDMLTNEEKVLLRNGHNAAADAQLYSQQALGEVRALRAAIEKITGEPVDVDEAAIARDVLTGLDAAAFAAIVPVNLAAQVADELAARLAGGAS